MVYIANSKNDISWFSASGPIIVKHNKRSGAFFWRVITLGGLSMKAQFQDAVEWPLRVQGNLCCLSASDVLVIFKYWEGWSYPSARWEYFWQRQALQLLW